MYKKVTRLLALLLALALIATGITTGPTQATAASKTKVGDAYYTIVSENSAIAEYAKPTKKTCTTATIPDTVKIGKKTYKVTSIAANAFKGCSKLKKVTIGKNVTKIGKKAFYGCKNLKTIKINSTKLTKKSVGSKAFAKINAKAVVTVPKNKLKAYKTVLKGAGLNGKGQKVKGEKEDTSYKDTYLTFDTDHPLPDPEETKFGINGYKDADSKKHMTGDTITFKSSVQFHQDLYGMWNTRKATGFRYECFICGKTCSSEEMWKMHYRMSCSGGHYQLGTESSTFDDYYWTQDPALCKVVYHFILPEGLSYKEGSLYVDIKEEKIDSNAYHVDVSGKEISVVIDNIKSEPYFYTDIEQAGSFIRRYINVTFDTEMNDSTSVDNTVKASVTYSYKGVEKTVNLGSGSASVHAASLQIANTDSDGNNITGSQFDLYVEKAVYPEGSNLGMVKWVKIASGISAGDVVTGLGDIDEDMEGRYRVVQTSAPDGYQKANRTEFDISINTNNGVTDVEAFDADGNPLPVKDGVIGLTVVNANDRTGNKTGMTTETISQDSNSPSSSNMPTGGNTAINWDQKNSVLVSYYKDGVRSFYATHKEDEIGSDGMLDTAAYVKSYADGGFSDCKLEKLTIDGEAVSFLPAKVPAGTEICYYYVTR